MSKKNKLIDKKQVFILSLDPYDQDLLVIVNGQVSDGVKYLKNLSSKKKHNKNVDKVLKYIKDNFTESELNGYILGNNTGSTYPDLPAGYIMLISHQSSWIETVKLVTHESLHVVMCMFRKIGLKLSDKEFISDEAYTYLLSKIVAEILNKMY